MKKFPTCPICLKNSYKKEKMPTLGVPGARYKTALVKLDKRTSKI